MIIELILAIILIQDPPNATIGQNVVWDHDGANTDHYEVNFDLTTWTSTQMNKMAPIPALTLGTHTVYVRACNIGQLCVDPVSLTFNIVATTPNPVTNLRIPPPAPIPTNPIKSGVKK